MRRSWKIWPIIVSVWLGIWLWGGTVYAAGWHLFHSRRAIMSDLHTEVPIGWFGVRSSTRGYQLAKVQPELSHKLWEEAVITFTFLPPTYNLPSEPLKDHLRRFTESQNLKDGYLLEEIRELPSGKGVCAQSREKRAGSKIRVMCILADARAMMFFDSDSPSDLLDFYYIASHVRPAAQ